MKVSGLQAESQPIRSYAELQKQLYRDLRVQHPEWINANGSSPILDLYARRLAELVAMFRAANRNG